MEKICVLKTIKMKAKQLKQQIIVLFLALRKSTVPVIPKAFIALVVAYALSPFDLIPDFIPILGYLDDLLLLPLGIWISLRLIPTDVLKECQREAEDNEIKMPKNKAAGYTIILLWIAFLIYCPFRIYIFTMLKE